MHIESLLTFFFTALLLAFVPGPDNVFVVTQAALRGRANGMSVVLGLCTGLIIHTTAVAMGVAVIFQNSELAFNFLKYVGSAYLLYLAWQAYQSPPMPSELTSAVSGEKSRLYFKAIFMNVTNPKITIFFLAFLPQFVDQQAGHVTLQIFVLGGLFILSALMSFSFMVTFAASVGTRFAHSAGAQKIMNRLAAVVFVGLAVKLATTQR